MSTKLLKGVGEWLTAIGIVGTVLAIFLSPLANQTQNDALKFVVEKGLGQLSLAVFFAGVLISIKDIKHKAQTTEDTASLIQKSLEVAQKYGPAVSVLSGVVAETGGEAAKDGGTAHIRASGGILKSHVTNELPLLVRRLQDLQNGRGKMELAEPYFVSRFLNSMQELLPDGSVWCGVTRMTRGWLEGHAEPGFLEFSEGLRHRAAEGKLSVFRIYDAGAHGAVAGFREHINKEVAAGISVRILGTADGVPDISLIWQPSERAQRAFSDGNVNPIRVLSSAEAVPICGLQFQTRFSSTFHSVSILPPGAPDFPQLLNLFARAWDEARPVEPPKTGSGADVPPKGVDRRFVKFEAA